MRVAYVLGEIFELSDVEAADALAVYRQRLRRARWLVTAFTQAMRDCLAGRGLPPRRVVRAMRLGRVSKGQPMLEGNVSSTPRIGEVRAEIAKLESGRAAAALMRSNPNFTTEVGELVLADLSGR